MSAGKKDSVVFYIISHLEKIPYNGHYQWIGRGKNDDDMWHFLDELDEFLATYYTIVGAIDDSPLNRAIVYILENHEDLRSYFNGRMQTDSTVAYLCDGRGCETISCQTAGSDCMRTLDIHHAKNFTKVSAPDEVPEKFMEMDEINVSDCVILECDTTLREPQMEALYNKLREQKEHGLILLPPYVHVAYKPVSEDLPEFVHSVETSVEKMPTNAWAAS